MGADVGSICTYVPGSPETEPAAGTVRDHGGSISDKVGPEIGLEGWILERQERRTLLAESIIAGARDLERSMGASGFGDKSCPSVLSAIGRKRTMSRGSRKPLRAMDHCN